MSQTSSTSRLHLGAFDQALDGWINTDITPHMWIARVPLAARALRIAGRISDQAWKAHRNGAFRKLRYLDLTKPFPFSDASLSAVFSSHVFEHLFLDEVERLVREIHRCLRPGGVCRVVVPDLQRIVAIYDAADPKPFLEAMFEIGRRSDIKNSHHSGFTGQSLTRLFEDAGFGECEVLSFRHGKCPDVDQLDNRPESIFFEATK